ncbi:hypothetical protein [Zooshikella sp. RANM57]|uniref:hypothetical protein n=1 Tax=Zooshikella sp. RANM57 TaxID=3425863 RepID=UPI003D6E6771
MAQRNRLTLKNYFQDGAIPTSQQFEDLIDSSVNIIEEGINSVTDKGLEIIAQEGQYLISFFSQHSRSHKPNWSINYNGSEQDLKLLRYSDDKQIIPALMTFSSSGCVGINNPKPIHDLDIAGVLKSYGRVGSHMLPPSSKAIADGNWHTITPTLSGCHAFEVMAGTGHHEKQQFALMHAIAMNTPLETKAKAKLKFFNTKDGSTTHVDGIKMCQTGNIRTGITIELQWANREETEYVLQIRTNQEISKKTIINYQLTQLWFDPDMNECFETSPPQDMKYE